MSFFDKSDRSNKTFGLCRIQGGTSEMMVSWTLLFSKSLSSNTDCILIPKVGIADSFLANSSLYFGLIVHSNAGLDGQD